MKGRRGQSTILPSEFVAASTGIKSKRRKKVFIPEIIKHISNEINNKYTNTIVFRTRIAFVVWVGPFIILSSFIKIIGSALEY